jgi:two-component system, cell cycle sensor histidine kinase PleC
MRSPTPLAVAIAPALARRDAILSTLSWAAVALLGSADWRGAIPELLERLGRATDASRVYLHEMTSDAAGRIGGDSLGEWAAPHATARPASSGQRFDYSGRFVRLLREGAVLDGRPREYTPIERVFFAAHGIRSVLCVPILLDGKWWGTLGMDDCRAERHWTQPEVDALQAAAPILASAIMRARTEAELAATNHRIRDAIESINDGFSLWDAEDRLVLWNARYPELNWAIRDHVRAGMTFREVVRHGVTSGMVDMLSATVEASIDIYVRRHQQAMPFRELVYRDGRVIAVREFRTFDGGIVRLDTDITAQRQAEAALRAKEAELQASNRAMRDAIDNMSDGFSLWDGDSRLRLWNRNFAAIYPAVADQLQVGVNFADLVRRNLELGIAPNGQDIEARIRDIVATRAVGGQRELALRDGRVIAIREHRTADGGIVRLDTDITADRRAEQVLRAKEAELAATHRTVRDALESMSEGFTLWDADDRLVLWNRRHVEFFPELAGVLRPGISFVEVLRHNVRIGAVRLGERPPDAHEAETVAAHRAGGKREVHTGDGRIIAVREYRTAEGGVVRLDTDITDIRQREAALVEAREQAETANRAKSTFIANMSHELRTPLNAIIGFADILRGQLFGPLATKYREYASDISHSGAHLLALINDLLDTAKVEAGKYELHREAVSIGLLVEDAFRVLARRAEESGVRLVHADAELPPWPLDRRAIGQVLLNLLSNAIKFSRRDGEANVAARVAGGLLEVSVADNGIGIPAQELPRLARPFEQVENVWSRSREGSGLGLAICKSLVELHGGTLEIASEIDRGTTVTFRLPR